MNPVIGLDHCIIAVHELEKARGIYEKLGFTAAPLGDHVNRATANYCLMFQDTYLELLGINQPEYPDGGLQQKLKSRGEGLHRLALGTSDADAVKAKIEALGVRTEGPTDLARPSKEPDGIVRFRNLFLEPEDLAGMPIFICGHKTPELMRNARLIDHPNGAICFAGITGLASDPAATAQALAKLFSAASIKETEFGAELDTGRGFIRLATDENINMAHKNLDAHPTIERPIWHVLSIGVNDLGKTEKYLKQAKISYTSTGSALRVNRNNACGLVLEFIS